MKFARYLVASGGYFKTLGIPLLRGRTFTAAHDSSARTAVISAAMAAQWWPNSDALGKTFRFPGDSQPITVIGIVADVREITLERELRPQMYLSIDREAPENIAVVARSSLPPATLLARLSDAVHAVDRSQAVYNVRMMDAVVANSLAPRRTNTTLIVLFGALALALSAFGVYAVVSYSVTQRRREFGIRAALGASRVDIAALVSREMLGVVVLGIALGLGGAWALTRVIAALLFQIDTHDRATFAAVPLLLLIPAAIATIIPARRAMALDPSEVMRAE
jgi:ABC-type antimicrobial peptide transport system permease subunit